MKVQYVEKSFRQSSLSLIAAMNSIMDGYRAQNYRLTVRQLYYQLVTRNLVANSEREYDKVTRLCNDARIAGLMDWDMIEDRTREFVTVARWESPADILKAAASGYHEDLWAGQEHRVFCIVEKDALSGVLEPVCRELDIPLLAARGYPSVSVVREFANNEIIGAMEDGQTVIVLHLGDHDPSGIDMSRDLRERLELFTEDEVEVKRIALNIEQVREFNPPENPAKMTDRRFADYARRFGTASWELDALPPEYLERLVREHAKQFIDPEAWAESMHAINSTKTKLYEVAESFTQGDSQ